MSITRIERKSFLKWMLGLSAGLFGLAKTGVSGRKDPKLDSTGDNLPVVNREPRAVARNNPFA